VSKQRRHLKDPRTPEQRRRDAIAARNRAWPELVKSLHLKPVITKASGAQFCPVGGA